MTTFSFDSVAAAYDEARPDYPTALYDALESALGQPLLRAHAVDVGAGTGIATRGLRGRGATVVSVDPGEGVLRRLRARSPRAAVVLGRGEALPLRDGWADLVAYAQSFHFVDPSAAVAEALRVLTPRGVLAMWWNVPARTAPWWAAHEARVAGACPAYHAFSGVQPPAELAAHDLRVGQLSVPWSRVVPVATYAAALRSHSYVIALGPQLADAFVAAEADRLEREGGPLLEEAFDTVLVIATRPQARGR